MVPPPIRLDAKGLVSTATTVRQPLPYREFHTAGQPARFTPIEPISGQVERVVDHAKEGKLLINASKESFVPKNHSQYQKALEGSHHYNVFESFRTYREKLIVHGLYTSATKSTAYALVPSEKFFIGEMAPVQLRHDNRYLAVANKKLFSLYKGRTIIRYLDMDHLPKDILEKPIGGNGWYTITPNFSHCDPEAQASLIYRKLDSAAETHLDNLSYRLPDFKRFELQSPSEVAIAKGYTKSKSFFRCIKSIGYIVLLRMGDFTLLDTEGRVLGFVEAKSIVMHRSEGIFDEKSIYTYFRH